MPQDAEVRQILIDGFNRVTDGLKDVHEAMKDHDRRLRALELKAARLFGALGFAGFLVGALIAVARHL
jgi:hypothetical protein